MGENKGISMAIAKLQEIYEITDEQMAETVGDPVYQAMRENLYDRITIADMQRIADAFGFVFVMNFQNLEQYLTDQPQGAGENENE